MRAIVFDMDGLMFNTEDVYTLVGMELLRRRGCKFTDGVEGQDHGHAASPGFETDDRPLPSGRHLAGVGGGVEPVVPRLPRRHVWR